MLASALLAGCGSGPESFYIPSCANYPTLRPGYHIEVQKPSGPVRRGDFVVYKSQLNPQGLPTPSDFVFRVVGLPGEEIGSVNGRVTINGQLLPEPYLPPATTTDNLNTELIPSGDYFVLGDNRSDAADSRSVGPISRKSIIGKSVGIRKRKPGAGISCQQ